MSAWRIETAKNSEKNSEQVIEKMAAAARALGAKAGKPYDDAGLRRR